MFNQFNQLNRLNRNQDEEGQNNLCEKFSEESDRKAFVRRVYALLFIIVFITFVHVLVSQLNHDVARFILLNHVIILPVAGVSYIFGVIVIFCCRSVQRKCPWNIFVLFFLVEGLSLIVTYLTLYYETYTILLAFGITAAVCLSISILAIFCPFDMTKYAPFLMIGGILVMLLSVGVIITSIFFYNRIMDVIYSSIIVVFVCLTFFFNTQMIFGGRYMEMEPSDTVLGASLLYVDIIVLFLFILRLLQDS